MAQQNKDTLENMLRVMTGLGESVDGAILGTSGFRDSVAALPPLLRPMIRARDTTVRALNAVLAQNQRVQSYAEQALGIIRDALNGDAHESEDGPIG